MMINADDQECCFQFQALFKLIEAPKTSLIWFSQETYKKYKATSTMECSLCSDIQVAG